MIKSVKINVARMINNNDVAKFAADVKMYRRLAIQNRTMTPSIHVNHEILTAGEFEREVNSGNVTADDVVELSYDTTNISADVVYTYTR